MSPDQWSGGAAQVEFSVPMGTPMAGYLAREGGVAGQADPLMIGAIWLESGDDAVAIVSVDIASVDEALTRAIAREAGIARDSLLLAASHTHGGPAGIARPMHLANDEVLNHALRRAFIRASSQVIRTARERAAPCRLSWGRTEVAGLAGNRNSPEWTAANAHDPGLTLLQLESWLGEPLGAIVHWPCHPTILSAGNRLLSADFPGALRRQLQRGGSEIPVLYLNGAAGDISTRFTRRDQSFDEVERFGVELERAARRASSTMSGLTPRLAHRSIDVMVAGWTEQEIEDILYENIVESNAIDDRRAVTRRQGRAMLQQMALSPCRPRRKRLRLDAWRIGEMTLVAVPGELFSSLGRQILESTADPALVVGYAGGYAGYLPDRRAYADETYEALASPYGPGSGERVADAAKKLVASLPDR